MYLSPYEFEKAKDGSLFIKKGKKLVEVSFDELAENLKKEVLKIVNTEQKVNALSKCLSQVKKYSKKHFITAFSLFELKALKGEIEVEDETLLELDEKVLSGELSVEEAIEKHEYLKTTFEELYGDSVDYAKALGEN